MKSLFRTIRLSSALAVPLLLAGQPTPQPAPPAPPAPPANIRAINLSMDGGFLGIGLQEINAERAKELKLKEEYGAEITRIWADSPAEKAGLKTGDVVLQYNGTRVEGMEQFSRLVRETPVSRECKLVIWRNGAEQTITAKIGQRPMPFGLGDATFRMPDVPRIVEGLRSPALGVEAEPVEGQLADFFGAKDGGVLVRSVGKSTPAEKAGLKAGDVIIRVEETKVTTPSEVGVRLRSAAGKSVSVALLREHKEMTVTVDVPEGARRNGRTNRLRLVMVDDAR